MKIVLSCIFAACVIGIAGEPAHGGSAEPDTLAGGDAEQYGNVTPSASAAFADHNQANEDFILLDVRTPEEFSEGHIKGARLIDFKDPFFNDSLRSLDRNKTYLLYCRSGKRSAQSAQRMKRMGFTSVYNMLTGIQGWLTEGLKVEK